MWYFIGVWAGSKNAIKQIQALLRNYLWSGRKHRARARVAWGTCTKKLRDGRLSLIDPQVALDCLMGKRLIKACELGNSNLLTFLRYRLSRYKLEKEGNWTPDSTWFMSYSHKSAPGSKIWNKAGSAWRKLYRYATWIKLVSFEEISNSGLWFNADLGNQIRPALGRERATELHKSGLRTINAVWHLKHSRGLTWPEARARHQFLRDEDEDGWTIIQRIVTQAYGTILTRGPLPPTPQDWLGLYDQGGGPFPILVIKGPRESNIRCEQRLSISILELPDLIFSVNPTSRTLVRIPNLSLWLQANPNLHASLEQDMDYEDKLTCIIRKVRVVEALKSTQRLPTNFFYGPILELDLDPCRYSWPDQTPLLQFTSKLARDWFWSDDTPVDLSRTRWRSSLPRNTYVDWKDTWCTRRAQKEAAFVWSVWQKAIAVNKWQQIANQNIDTSCPTVPASPNPSFTGSGLATKPEVPRNGALPLCTRFNADTATLWCTSSSIGITAYSRKGSPEGLVSSLTSGPSCVGLLYRKFGLPGMPVASTMR